MKKRYIPYPEKEFPVGTVIGIIALIIVIIAIASVVSNYSSQPKQTQIANTDRKDKNFPERTRCYPDLPRPKLLVTGTEDYEANNMEWTRYKLAVINWAYYPNEFYKPAPDLPPCGLNSNASRTWVDIYDENGRRLYGFCAQTSPRHLEYIWFAVERGKAPPEFVYITMTDRKCKITYTSNLASTDIS